MPVEMVTIKGVELAAVGDWPTERGWGKFTAEDLESMAVHAAATEFSPRIKLGHGMSGLGAVPAWGRVENIHVDETTGKLVGDLTHVPKPLADVMPAALPGRSIEGVRGRKTADGSKIPMVMTRLALLGVEEPAMDSLQDLHAAMVGESDLVIHAAASLAGLTVAEFEASLITVGDSPGEPSKTSTQEDDIVPETPETLAADAAKAAADKLAADKLAADAVAATEAADAKAKADAEVAEKAKIEADAAEAKAKAKNAPKLPEGVTAIDTNVLKQMQDEIAELRKGADEQIAASRDSFLEDAIGAGRIAPASRDTFAKLLLDSPESTKALINSFPENTIPVAAARGHEGDPASLDDDNLDAAYESRYGKSVN